MDVGNQYCSKNLNFSVTISTLHFISSAWKHTTIQLCYLLPFGGGGVGCVSTTTFTLLHWSQIHFFFHKKITHPLISKIIRHNDKTCTLIFKVLKVQKLMIYCNSEGTQKKAINAYALMFQYRVLFVNEMNKICS